MEDIRPTAKWANRMLRPLTSIYHRLEKHNEIVTSVLVSKAREKEKGSAVLDAEQRTRSSRKAGTAAGTTSTTTTEQGYSYSDDEEPNDPAWIPGKPMDKRRIRHNYSTRGRGLNGAGPRRRSRLLIRSPEAPKTLPGAIEIATPLITGKIRGALAESSPSLRTQLFQGHLADGVHNGLGGPAENRKPGRTKNNSFKRYHGSWKEVLDQSGDPGLVDIAHLLDRIFLKFLGNTRPSPPEGQEDGPQQGARSLLSMTVRRLPEFIAEEQRMQDESEEDGDVDMCDAYFTELEAAYAPSGNGWQPLREAVRAQGIYLVSGMIQQRWITSLAACRLLEECLSQQELDAFESLQTTLLASVEEYHYPSRLDPARPSGHCNDPIQILMKYYIWHPARHTYVFEELSRLLTRGAIPPEWMVTMWWKKSVDQAIMLVSTEGRGYAAARRLIEAVILSSAGIYSRYDSKVFLKENHNQAPRTIRSRGTRTSISLMSELSNDQSSCPVPIQDALSNLISSLLTALCGICIARSQAPGADERSAGLKMRGMVNYLAFTVQQAVENEAVTHDLGQQVFQPLRRGYVLLADCTLQCGGSVTAEIIYHSESVSRRNIESFFRALASRENVVRDLARLVSQVFHHSGSAHDRSSVRTPREIRARVSQLAHLTSATGVIFLLGKVAVEVAMAHAEGTLHPDDHIWAVEIQETVASFLEDDGFQQSHSSSQEYTSLYRWEDSIGEWVARTPAAKPRVVTTNIATRPQLRRRGRPRIIACSTSSSSASSICSEKSVSSATSSAPSVPKKRPCTSQYSDPRPFKKAYNTRYAERGWGKEGDWTNSPDYSPCQSSSEAGHAPVAARTRTAVKDELRQTSADQQGTTRSRRAGNTPVGPIPAIEVVIINKNSRDSGYEAAPKDHTKPIKRPARHSSIIPRASSKYSDRRRSAPAPIIRRRTAAAIPCSQDDDSDDELSFL
ncbi:hypothetical protein ASPVEDRAFT_39935 [Aspergillus versicolor CBS 583.65]|uniref:Uncharacterized protein n=1 Tax=Aspergillus versicolor CBS 583.65 TaxID=1036611 RepID=A0A1L9PG36_ASPVE|nr:uncharacterized protein ASPVEDRAFT_39935 [Aspergillus versicolor CBS 583.65]OJJ00452.1 hypothetical protein ASPVEDRAFT_39935 [Aspergillus versicolor CBS 583.65]